jgi:hypothetical protein
MPAAADGANVPVTVTCTDFTDDFSVTLSANATSGPNCEDSDSATANVVVNKQPVVTITDVSPSRDFCRNASDLGNLTFAYNVSSGPANTSMQVSLMTVGSNPGCELDDASSEGATGSEHY